MRLLPTFVEFIVVKVEPVLKRSEPRDGRVEHDASEVEDDAVHHLRIR